MVTDPAKASAEPAWQISGTNQMTPEQYKELNDRLNHLEDMLKDIRDKLNSPDYNISLTIPKPADCIGKCQSDLSIDQHKTAIPWE